MWLKYFFSAFKGFMQCCDSIGIGHYQHGLLTEKPFFEHDSELLKPVSGKKEPENAWGFNKTGRRFSGLFC